MTNWSARGKGAVPVGRQDDGLAVVSDAWNGVPELPAGHWVHTGRRFVQEDNGRIADQSHGRTQFPFVSTAARPKNNKN